MNNDEADIDAILKEMYEEAPVGDRNFFYASMRRAAEERLRTNRFIKSLGDEND